jgi:hypothetical protein
MFPFARLATQPTAADPLVKVFVDPELGAEGFTYVLKSGRENTVHVDEVLEETSPAQFYRLLDQTNYRKSVDQLPRLLQALDCDVDLVVRTKSA